MSLARKLKSAGLWQLFQILCQIIIQFGYIALMARLLSKEDFGLMAIVTAFIGLGMVFSTGGMGSALIQRKELTEKHINAAFQGALILGVVVFMIFYILSGVIAGFYNEPKLEIIIKVIGLVIIFDSLSSVSRSLLQRSFKFKITANITIAITLIGYMVGVFLALLGHGVWSLIAAALSISILSASIMFYYAPIKIGFEFYYKEFKQLFSYGFGIILLGLNNYLASGGLNLVLGKIFPPVLLGMFERSYLIKTLPSQHLGNVLDTIMFPAMSQIQDDEIRLFRIYQYSLGVVNTILMPTALYLIYFSKEIVLLLLGSKWLEVVVPLQIMFCVLPLSAAGRMADSVIRAKGYIYRNAARKFIYSIFLISTTAFGAKYFGLVGAAVAVTMSYLFNYYITLLLVSSIFKKSVFVIICQPLFSGAKLTIIVFLLVAFSTYILNYWLYDSMINFFMASFFVGASMLIIIWYKPALLGFYVQEVLARIFPRRNMK